MRRCIVNALEHAAELTRKNRLADAFAAGEAAIREATEDERAEIRTWLATHTDDFTGRTEN